MILLILFQLIIFNLGRRIQHRIRGSAGPIHPARRGSRCTVPRTAAACSAHTQQANRGGQVKPAQHISQDRHVRHKAGSDC